MSVDVFPLVPPVVAFVIAFFCSMGGVSGAFLLLPFQVSVLGFTSPAVSPTNLVYNIVAIPGGVFRYIREGKMAWPIALVIIIGTIPGIFLGVVLRISFLPDPAAFKLFVGCVLLYIGGRLLKKNRRQDAGQSKAGGRIPRGAGGAAPSRKGGIKTTKVSISEIGYDYSGESFSFRPIPLTAIALVVGVVGGTYGIGGGAIMAPFLIAVFGLPVYTIAGATLLATFLTSVIGVIFYTIIAPFYAHTGLAISPDWILGLLFGVGGLAGTYCGARAQKHLPEKAIKIILALGILTIAARYIVGYFV